MGYKNKTYEEYQREYYLENNQGKNNIIWIIIKTILNILKYINTYIILIIKKNLKEI